MCSVCRWIAFGPTRLAFPSVRAISLFHRQAAERWDEILIAETPWQADWEPLRRRRV